MASAQGKWLRCSGGWTGGEKTSVPDPPTKVLDTYPFKKSGNAAIPLNWPKEFVKKKKKKKKTLFRSVTRICDHWATHRRVESPSGRRDSRGFLYLPTSAKAVTRRDGPLGSFKRKEGFRYSKVIPTSSGRWKTPNCPRWSNFSWSSSSLPRADWGGSLSALEHSLFD